MALLLQMPWRWHDGGHMSMHWGWWLFWLILLMVLVWLVVTSTARAAGPSGARRETQMESSEETLRRRFAKGEIDEDEFERRLDKLRGSRG